LAPKRPAATPTGPKWHKFTKRGKADLRQRSDFDDFIAPFLRDISGSGRYSRATVESLCHPESEELNLELVSIS
jgi:hypothetical protein